MYELDDISQKQMHQKTNTKSNETLHFSKGSNSQNSFARGALTKRVYCKEQYLQDLTGGSSSCLCLLLQCTSPQATVWNSAEEGLKTP